MLYITYGRMIYVMDRQQSLTADIMCEDTFSAQMHPPTKRRHLTKSTLANHVLVQFKGDVQYHAVPHFRTTLQCYIVICPCRLHNMSNYLLESTIDISHGL